MRCAPEDIREAQEYFGFAQPAPVEKDWYVVQALRAIAALDVSPFQLVFAGGTCLARAHRLVQRMSEDVDLKVVHLDEKPLSQNQRRRLLGTLRDQVTAALQGAGFSFDPANPDHLRSRDASQYTVYHLPYGESDGTAGILRPSIMIELNYAVLRQEPVNLPVSTFVGEAFGSSPEIASIPCVSITETAAEKLVSLTRRTAMELAGASRAIDPTLVRHIYDLHQIRNHIDRQATIALAREIARQDAAEFKNQYPAYHADIAGETRKAILSLQSDPTTHARYSDFVTAMVYGESVNFDIAIATSISLAENTWP